MDIAQKIEPIWKENYSAIAMASSDEYLSYLCVCLQSLINNTSKNHNYDIVILSSGKDNKKKQIIIDKYTNKNVSIRFYNPSHHFNEIKSNLNNIYFDEASYYRIIIPEAMSNYDKVVFSDIDLIYNTDAKELYETNIENYPIAACIEPIWQNYTIKNREKELKYAKEQLNIDYNKYFNAGVILINIREFIKNNYCEKLKEIIKTEKLMFQEQCALNLLFNSNFKVLQPYWNYEVSKETSDEYKKSWHKKAKIIHWIGKEKPWLYSTKPYANSWWKYAKNTPFYTQIKSKQTSLFKKIGIFLKEYV